MPVSVIMPAYNATRWLPEAVASVLAQSWPEWELLIIDDCSSDSTYSLACSYSDPRIRVLQTERNSGAAAARNLGTRAARHDWLCYLDADDRLTPTALHTLFSQTAQHPQAGVIYANYVRIDGQGRRYGSRRWLNLLPRPSGDVLRAFLKQNRMVNGGLALVRKSAVHEVGGWPEDLQTREDGFLWSLIASRYPFHYIPRFVALEYREQRSGLNQTYGARHDIHLKAIERRYAHPLITARLSVREIESLRRYSLSRMHGFIAGQHARRRQWRAALSEILQALRTDWRATPRHLLNFMKECVDGLR